MAESKRVLGNWLQVYNRWTLPRSEAPASMVLWAGLFTLASALKRKVCFPRALMGSYEIYPNLYCIFVGQPGVVRKSTTAGYAEELLLEVNNILKDETMNISPTAISASKLIESISKTDDASLTIVSSEFSSFIGTSKEQMYELLTDIFDGKRKFDYATRAHSLELADQPVVNLLAATTPSWISKQPPEHFLGGGFASRVIFVYETKRRQYKMYYDDVNYKEIEDLGKLLVADLAHITTLKGHFKHETPELRNEMESWYKAHAEKGASDTRLSGYYERKHVHVHKVAMLLSVAERDDLIVTKAHFEAAKILLSEIEEKMPRALASIGTNPIGHHLYDMLDFIRDREEVTKKTLMARFFRDLNREQISELIDSLEVLDHITVTPNGKNPSYKAKK